MLNLFQCSQMIAQGIKTYVYATKTALQMLTDNFYLSLLWQVQ